MVPLHEITVNTSHGLLERREEGSEAMIINHSYLAMGQNLRIKVLLSRDCHLFKRLSIGLPGVRGFDP